ncbi:MAG: leucine-rich repeat protein [Ruminococcus sp.]|nr:leucine-rich repeat protein [Ruminococcus sp.]
MKKIIAFIAALLILPQPLHTHAESEILSETIGNSTFYYTVNSSQNAVITDCFSYEENIIIPSSLGGYRVTEINEKAFFGKITLTSVTLPEGITHIGDNAFSGCLSLESIKIPETVTHLGNGCFTSCSELESVVLNNSILSIPDNCFNACTSLKNINIPDSTISIGKEAFFGCSDISGIFIPPNVEIIGENALGMHYDIRGNGIEKINDFSIKGLPDTVAADYAESNNIELCFLPGDVNSDNLVDSVDAAFVLCEYAYLSTGKSGTFDRYQTFAGDYDGNELIDSVDAAMILIEYTRLQTTLYKDI